MITSRYIDREGDTPLLETSLSVDEFHKDTPAEFFFMPGSACSVVEDEKGPVFFLRGTKALRLDVQFVDNNDHERNAEALVGIFDGFVENAKKAGFTELVFWSDSPALRVFCRRKFGFREVKGELRRFI